MDRSQISAAIPDVVFTLDGDRRRRHHRPRPRARSSSPRSARRCRACASSAYGPHVDDDAADAARAAGADVVHAPVALLPRPRRRDHSPEVTGAKYDGGSEDGEDRVEAER